MRQFNSRCSQIGAIMTQPRNKSDLISKTTQTYLIQWVKEQIFERQKEFSSKYTEKGVECENESIEVVTKHLSLGLTLKNETFFENDFLCGTPDIITSSLVIDVKNSWDCFTFPLLNVETYDQNYYWQLQGYMALVGRNEALLVYTLLDAPQRLIDDEIRRMCYKLGLSDLPIEMEQDVYKKMTYGDIPTEKKIRIFEIKRNNEDIEKIYDAVKLCRDFINQLKF